MGATMLRIQIPLRRIAWVLGCLLAAGAAQSQELAPRAYWPAPDGTNVLLLAYQYSTGDVVTDPSLPVAGVDSRIHVTQAAFQRTFGFLGRTSSLQLAVPYSWATTEGTYLGEPASRVVDGWADARLRFAINLLGAPTMDTQAFRVLAAHPVTQVGFSLTVQAPTGQYDPQRLINLGTNRWSVKPAFGVIYPFTPSWMLEFELGGWFFGDNDEFVGQTREQEPILSTEAHLVKNFRRWGRTAGRTCSATRASAPRWSGRSSDIMRCAAPTAPVSSPSRAATTRCSRSAICTSGRRPRLFAQCTARLSTPGNVGATSLGRASAPILPRHSRSLGKAETRSSGRSPSSSPRLNGGGTPVRRGALASGRAPLAHSVGIRSPEPCRSPAPLRSGQPEDDRGLPSERVWLAERSGAERARRPRE